MRSRRGMTLIEVLAVMALIMLVMAMALPNFAEMMRAQRWTAATAAFQNALRRCRSWAINERRDHAVEICTDADNRTQYLRIETESAVLESLPELNAYYRSQCEYIMYGMPVDWLRIFEAGGGDLVNHNTSYYYVDEDARFEYTGPRYDVDGWSWRVPNRVKDNYLIDEEVELPHQVHVDFKASVNLMNFDARPSGPLDRPQYGWDDTLDIRFAITGMLVQSKNPEIVLVNNANERVTLQVLRSTGRVRRLSGPQ